MRSGGSPMNKAENNRQFDMEALRKQVSDVNNRGDADGEKVDAAGAINPYARQIAEQFRERTRSPSIIIGQFRLFEFLSQFALGLLAFLIWPGDGSQGLLGRLSMALIIGALTVVALQISDTYSIPALRAR